MKIDLHHLRPGRLAAADDDGRPRPGPRPQALPGRSLATQVSNLKNELVDEETYEPGLTAPEKVLRPRPTRSTSGGCARRTRMDFDDLIMTTVHLLQAFPDVAEHYRRRFRHVLVDEYQDTNHAQYVLVRELVGAGRRPGARRPSCAWSATPTSRSTPSAARPSATSWSSSATTPTRPRSCWSRTTAPPRRILPAANAVIARNTCRRPKNLWSDAGDGELIVGYVADNEHDEAAWVAEQIDALTDEGLAQPKDIAVFYRTNNASRVFEEVFIRVGLPYKVVGGVRFYERREVRDALAYLGCVANPADVVSLRRVLNTPKRGIGDRAEACVERFADRERIPFARRCAGPRRSRGLATRSLKAIEEFVALLEEFEQLVETGSGPAALLESVLDRTGYLAELAASTDPQDEGRVENLNELVAVAARVRGRHARAARSPTSWSRSRWSPTPTRSRTPATTPAWSR